MANRIPLIVDTLDDNKIKELPAGDNLDLGNAGLTNVGSVNATDVTINGVSFNNPFSGNYNDLTNKPIIPVVPSAISAFANDSGYLVFGTDTDSIPEGLSNLYHSTARVDARIQSANLSSLNNVDPVTSADDGKVVYYNHETQTFKFTNVVTESDNLQSILTRGNTSDKDIVTTGKVYFQNVFATVADLPNPSTYHGMFAHVHGTGKGYYAHAGSWIPLATESQVANIAFSNINSKPTTIAGYGITDAVVDFADLGVTPTTLAGYGITDVVPTELSDLTDVSISTPSDGQIMIWNGSNNRFEVGEIGSAITTFEKGIYEVATNKSHALDTNVTGDATANSGGTVIFDTSINGNLFHYWNNQMSSSYWTADITNVQTSNYQFTNVTLIIRQQAWGNTSTVGSLPTTYKLDGQTHSIQWADGLAPSATINGVDVIQLTIMPIQTSDGSGVPIFDSYSILGTHTSHPHQQ